MEYNKESFKKALKKCGIIRWENHFEKVVKAYIEVEYEQLTIPVVSRRSDLLPDFLYEDDGIIKVGVHGDSAVTEEWNDYLKKTGNCG